MTEHEKHGQEEKVSFSVSGNTLLAVSILLSSIILTSGIIIGAGNLGAGLADMQLSTGVSGSGSGGGGTGTLTGTGTPAPSTAPPAPAPTPAAPASARLSDVVSDADLMLGDPNAPITVVEFSDFQCPFCKRFFDSTLSQVEDEYINAGKVRFVYKHFPLDSIHPQARPAALASECAAEQGKFWEFHDRIFENQALMSPQSYKQWAGELGLDQGAFDSCFDESKYADKVEADFSLGRGLGVGGTPTFLIGPSDGEGQLLVGAQPFSAFKSTLDALN